MYDKLYKYNRFVCYIFVQNIFVRINLPVTIKPDFDEFHFR